MSQSEEKYGYGLSGDLIGTIHAMNMLGKKLAIKPSVCILCISLFMSILCLARGQDLSVGASETISTFAGFRFH